MKWITHQTGAILLATGIQSPLATIMGAGAGAILPDLIDQRISGLASGKKGKQKIFNRIHRGNSHWFGWWLLAFLMLGVWTQGALLQEVCLGLALGALSHVFLDMLTPQGVPILPFTHGRRLSLKLCSTGSMREYVFLGAMIGCGLIFHSNAIAGKLESAAVLLRNLHSLFTS